MTPESNVGCGRSNLADSGGSRRNQRNGQTERNAVSFSLTGRPWVDVPSDGGTAWDNRRPTVRLGILADIHEHSRRLQKAIAVLQEHGAERFVVLGDVFDTGKRIEKTVRLLEEVNAVGVWGNHEAGLCFDTDARLCERYGAGVLGFMGGREPHVVME